jgi:hypothetical protein
MPPQDQELTDEDREAAKLLRRMLQAQAKLDAQGAANVPQGYELVQETADGGKIYRKPDGQLTFTSSGYATNNQSEIQRMMQGATPGAARRTETNRQIVEQDGMMAGAASAIKGIPFVGEYIDEAVGMVTGDPRTTAAMRENAAAFQEQKPLEAFGGQMGLGTVATLPLIPFQAAGQAIAAAPTLGRQILAGAGFGAVAGGVEGAVSGFGAGEGSAEERAPSAAIGAGFGAGLGGLLGAGAAPIEMAVKNALQYWGNKPVRDMAKNFGISNDAAKVVLAAIQDGDFPTAQAALNRAGSASMLAEASPTTKNLLDAAIALGSGGDRAQQALLARNLRGEQEMRGAFDRFLGKPEDITDVTGNIRQGTAAQRRELYNSAYSKDIDYSSLRGQELQNLLQFVPPEALRYANKIRSMDPEARAPQIVFSEEPDGAVRFGTGANAPGAAAAPKPSDVPAFEQKFAKEAQRLIDYNGGVDKAIDAQQYVIDQLVKNNASDDRINKAVSLRFAIQRMGERANRELDNLPPLAAAAPTASAAPRPAKPIDPNTNYNIDPRDGKFVIRTDAGEEVLGAPEFSDRKQALAWLQGETRKARQGGGAAPAAAAGPQPQTRFNVEQWDLITRGLNEMAYGSPAGVMGGKSEIQSLAAKNAREIRKLVMEQVPEYRAALGLARETIEEVKAAEIGYSMLQGGTTVKEVKDMLSGQNPAAAQSMKLGLRSGLDHMLGNLKVAAANPNTEVKELMAGLSALRSRNNMAKVRALLGDKDADEFYKVLDEQATGIELAAAVAANSKTAQRQAVGRSVEEIAAPGILGTMLRGEPVNASRMIVQSVTGKTPEADAARRMGLYDDIATVLTRLQGQRAKDALNLIQQAKAGKALNDVQAAIIAKAVTTPAAIGAYKAITSGQTNNRIAASRPYQAGMGREATE